MAHKIRILFKHGLTTRGKPVAVVNRSVVVWEHAEMSIRITQIDDHYGANDSEMNLKVEGQLHEPEAELLEKVCQELAGQSDRRIALDLANIGFLDSDSAAVLCRLKRELGVRLKGLRLFIGKVVELAEEYERVKKYRLDAR